jgi:hypothetical protein
MQIENKSGQIENFFSESELTRIQTLFKHPSLIDTGGEGQAKTTGLDQKNVFYPLFDKLFFKKLQMTFGKNLKLVWAMWCDSHEPFDLHTDKEKHQQSGLPGKPWISFLVPFSVDHDITKTNLANTIIFNEHDICQPCTPNALDIFETHCSHASKNRLACVTLQKKIDWNRGSVIWWHSLLVHGSGHFLNFSTKQMVVIHTYIV